MHLRRALLIAACGFPLCAGPALAQFQPAPQQQQPQQEPPPCIKEFLRLRDDAQKKASVIQAASQRKAPPQEACGLFNSFSAAETKMIKYAEENSVWCGIPPQAVETMKKQHAQTAQIRTRVCHAATAGPARPAAPVRP